VVAGKNPHNAIADWLAERLIDAGAMTSEQVHVDATGRETVTPY
jgi:hypothetical protein